MILRTLNFFHRRGEAVEICAIGLRVGKHALWEGFAGGKKGIVAGWFNDLDAAARAAERLDKIGAEGIYHTLNPCSEALLSRSNNRLKAGVDRTQDKEILALRWLLIDIDPRRVTGVSSTDEEHGCAIARARAICGELAGRGWPGPLLADSGNGAHLVYRLPDLPNTEENVTLLRLVLQSLSELFSGPDGDVHLEIDKKVFNPARISKIYGTMTRKGDHTEARPHRAAAVIDVPAEAPPVTLVQLRAISAGAAREADSRSSRAQKPADNRDRGGTNARLDVSAYLAHYDVHVRKVKMHGSSTMYVLDRCVFNPSHSGGDAAVCQQEDGKLYYQCFHDSCRTQTWSNARSTISGNDSLAPFMSGLEAARSRKQSPDRSKSGGKRRDNPGNDGGGNGQDASGQKGSDDGVEARIRELNMKHSVIMVGGKCVVMNEYTDPVFCRPEISFTSVGDFRNFYGNEKYWLSAGNGKTYQMDIGRLWLGSEHRRQYEGITFSPGAEHKGYYNLFRGFAMKPEPGDWSLFSHHIFEVICGENQEIYNYVIAWLAHLFQCPGKERPGTAIVLRGRQGTGKGRFATHVGAILGSHYLHITHQKQLLGNFNNHLKDALFCFVDEGIWAGDKQAEGALKAMITEDRLAIEPKGKDVFMVQNFLRLLIATNNDWAIPAGLEERRFLVLDVSDGHMQDRAYFDALEHQMEHGGREAMLHDLLGLDISGINLREAPKTSALLDQIVHTMSVAHKFWFELLWDGRLREDDDHWAEQDVPYSSVFKRYVGLSERMKEYRPHIHLTLIRELKKLCPGMYTVRRRDEYHKLTNYLVVPPLEECRAKFESLIRMPVAWPADGAEVKRVRI